MRPNEYQLLAQRTECDQESSKTNITQGGLKYIRLIHSCIGMQSDFYELQDASNRTNIKEELGDLLWYLAEAANALGWTFESRVESMHTPKTSHLHLDRIGQGLADFAYCLEKILYYNKTVELRDLEVSLMDIYQGIAGFAELYGFTVEEIMVGNIDKLKTRFPQKFDEVANNSRDRAAEAVAIEGAFNRETRQRAMDDGPDYSKQYE